jgi:hypothetical protein
MNVNMEMIKKSVDWMTENYLHAELKKYVNDTFVFKVGLTNKMRVYVKPEYSYENMLVRLDVEEEYIYDVVLEREKEVENVMNEQTLMELFEFVKSKIPNGEIVYVNVNDTVVRMDVKDGDKYFDVIIEQTIPSVINRDTFDLYFEVVIIYEYFKYIEPDKETLRQMKIHMI